MRSGVCTIMGNDLHWLAGLLEGEGCFSRSTPARPRTISVSVNMTDLDVIERVADLLRSGVYQCRKASENLQAQYSAQVGGGSAVSLLRLLRPLMGLRRQALIDRARASYRPTTAYGHKEFYVLRDELPEHERYWLAGYLEGEGCFEIQKFVVKNVTYLYPRVEITTTDEDVLQRVQQLWKQRYNLDLNILSRQPAYRGSKLTYRIIANNEAAQMIMEDMLPLMGQRRQAKIREILGQRPGRQLRERRAPYYVGGRAA